MLLNYHTGRFVLVSLCVGYLVRLVFEWCPCCSMKHSRAFYLHVVSCNNMYTLNVFSKPYKLKLLYIGARVRTGDTLVIAVGFSN